MEKTELTGRVIAGALLAGLIDGVATVEAGGLAAAGGGIIRGFGDKNYSALDAFQNGCAGGAVVAAIPAIAVGTAAAMGHPANFKGGSSTFAGTLVANALIAGLGGLMTHNEMGFGSSALAGGTGTIVVTVGAVAVGVIMVAGVAAVLACASARPATP